MKKWYWKEGYILQEEECDFLDLQKTFAALAISPRSRIYGEDNESIDENSHNVCFNVEHVQEGGRDSDGVYVPMKPVLEQKYTVDGKGYTVSVTVAGRDVKV